MRRELEKGYKYYGIREVERWIKPSVYMMRVYVTISPSSSNELIGINLTKSDACDKSLPTCCFNLLSLLDLIVCINRGRW